MRIEKVTASWLGSNKEEHASADEGPDLGDEFKRHFDWVFVCVGVAFCQILLSIEALLFGEITRSGERIMYKPLLPKQYKKVWMIGWACFSETVVKSREVVMEEFPWSVFLLFGSLPSFDARRPDSKMVAVVWFPLITTRRFRHSMYPVLRPTRGHRQSDDTRRRSRTRSGHWQNKILSFFCFKMFKTPWALTSNQLSSSAIFWQVVLK
jgi:hypothetical protein